MRASLAAFAALVSGAAPSAAQHLAVVSRADNVLVIHDAATGEEVDRVAIGQSTHEIALAGSGGRAFLASYGGNTVHAIDLSTRDTRALTLDGYTSLHGIVAARDGHTVWVTAEESDALLELDAERGTVVRVWPTRGALSHMVTVTPNGQKLYVANITSGTVSVIDRETGTTTIVETGAGAEGIDISPDGAEVWVSNRGENTISIIDTATDRVVLTFGSGGSFPVKLRFRPDGREVWVANNQSGSVAVFDRRQRERVAAIEVGVRPLGLAFSGDSRQAYVTRPGANQVVEIDTNTKAVTRRFPTAGSPDGIVWIP